jgi:hypothetical protein
MNVKVVRIFADDAGESHFAEVFLPLSVADLAPPMTPLPVSAPMTAERVVFFHGPQAEEGGAWHPAPKRQLMFVLSGMVEITVSDGETRTFTPGSVLLAEDVHGKGHSGRRPAPGGMTAALVQLG